MINTVDEYLDELKLNLDGSDSATIQDALSDAEEHLVSDIEGMQEADPGIDQADALQRAIDNYGTPAETAAAYLEVEKRTPPGLARVSKPRQRSWLGRFFGIYADSRAWGAILYMLISLLTGIVYFTWATMGIAISVSFSLFIFGLPLVLFFLISVRGFALLEGRIDEALLGVRMPRRPLFFPRDVKFLQRLKMHLLDPHSWKVIIYLLLQLPIGIIYFYITVIVLALSLSGIAIPIIQGVFNLPIGNVDGVHYYVPTLAYPLVVLAGILLWTVYMHLAKLIGRLHGRYAKAMLVTE